MALQDNRTAPRNRGDFGYTRLGEPANQVGRQVHSEFVAGCDVATDSRLLQRGVSVDFPDMPAYVPTSETARPARQVHGEMNTSKPCKWRTGTMLGTRPFNLRQLVLQGTKLVPESLVACIGHRDPVAEAHGPWL